MAAPQPGERLIRDLLADPRKFDDEGRAYELLQAYFEGLPLETLRPPLRNDNALIQRSAAFIASELGAQARSLIADVIPLLESNERYRLMAESASSEEADLQKFWKDTSGKR